MGGLHLNPEGNQRFFNNFKSSLLAHCNNFQSMNAVSLESLNGNAQELYICRPVYSKSFTDLPSHQGLRMASLNINGPSTHVDELRVYLATNDIDILAINETKLDESIMEGEVNICGYDIVRRDRERGGG